MLTSACKSCFLMHNVMYKKCTLLSSGATMSVACWPVHCKDYFLMHDDDYALMHDDDTRSYGACGMLTSPCEGCFFTHKKLWCHEFVSVACWPVRVKAAFWRVRTISSGEGVLKSNRATTCNGDSTVFTSFLVWNWNWNLGNLAFLTMGFGMGWAFLFNPSTQCKQMQRANKDGGFFIPGATVMGLE